MKKITMTLACISLLGFCSCKKELISYEQGDLKVHIEQGPEWLHDFPLALGIKKKNAPQIAVWIEDPEGRHITTLYASYKIATQSWTAAGENRRKESLPHWCHVRNVQYADGLYLPTKAQPLADAITGATPRESFDLKLRPNGNLQRFVVKVEVNHSIDFNDHYPRSAAKDAPNYSGGKLGSGQPAVVYAAEVDLTSDVREFEARLIGHSSSDGSQGTVDPDISTLTTALHIVKRVTIYVR